MTEELMPSPAGQVTDLTNAGSQALATQAQAQIMAMMSVADMRPRDVSSMEVALHRECQRPGFADSACYSIKIGGKQQEGPGVALYRAAATLYKHLDVSVVELPSDDRHGHVRAVVHDMQNNVRFTSESRFLLRVYRSSNWVNLWESQGGNTENDKRNLKRRIAGYVLRYALADAIPKDIIQSAYEKAHDVKHGRAKADLAGKKRKETLTNLRVAFENLQVTAEMLEEYLGHTIDSISPVELSGLRSLHKAIVSNEVDKHVVFAKSASAQRSDAAAELQKEMEAATGGEPPNVSEEEEEAAMAKAEAASARNLDESSDDGEDGGFDPETGELFEGSEKRDYD